MKNSYPVLRRATFHAQDRGDRVSVSHDAGILATTEGRRYIVVLYCEVEPKPDHVEAAWVNPMMTAWMRSVREHL